MVDTRKPPQSPVREARRQAHEQTNAFSKSKAASHDADLQRHPLVGTPPVPPAQKSQSSK